jgi:hypothetical protein
MDFIRILQETHNIVHKNMTIVLMASQKGRRILLRNDEYICEVYRRLAEEDGWLYLEFDTQKRFG